MFCNCSRFRFSVRVTYLWYGIVNEIGFLNPRSAKKSPFVTRNVHFFPFLWNATTYMKTNFESRPTKKCQFLTENVLFRPFWWNSATQIKACVQYRSTKISACNWKLFIYVLFCEMPPRRQSLISTQGPQKRLSLELEMYISVLSDSMPLRKLSLILAPDP